MHTGLGRQVEMIRLGSPKQFSPSVLYEQCRYMLGSHIYLEGFVLLPRHFLGWTREREEQKSFAKSDHCGREWLFKSSTWLNQHIPVMTLSITKESSLEREWPVCVEYLGPASLLILINRSQRDCWFLVWLMFWYKCTLVPQNCQIVFGGTDEKWEMDPECSGFIDMMQSEL